MLASQLDTNTSILLFYTEEYLTDSEGASFHRRDHEILPYYTTIIPHEKNSICRYVKGNRESCKLFFI